MKTDKLLDKLIEQCSVCGGDHEEAPQDANQGDNEASMAKSDLYNLVQDAQELHDMLSEDYPLEDWAEAKITKAADYINSVLKYISYDIKGQGEEPGNSPVAVYIATNPNMLKGDI